MHFSQVDMNVLPVCVFVGLRQRVLTVVSYFFPCSL